jgi:hypothetical protein
MRIKAASMGIPKTAGDLYGILKPFFARITLFKILILFIICLFALLFVFFAYQYGNAPRLQTIFI